MQFKSVEKSGLNDWNNIRQYFFCIVIETWETILNFCTSCISRFRDLLSSILLYVSFILQIETSSDFQKFVRKIVSSKFPPLRYRYDDVMKYENFIFVAWHDFFDVFFVFSTVLCFFTFNLLLCKGDYYLQGKFFRFFRQHIQLIFDFILWYITPQLRNLSACRFPLRV